MPLSVPVGVGHRLTEDETVQVLAQKPGAYLGGAVAILVCGGLLWATAARAFAGHRSLIELAWIFSAAAATAGEAAALRVAWACGEERQRLAIGRLWKPWRLLLGRIWLVSTVTMIIGVWWASR